MTLKKEIQQYVGKRLAATIAPDSYVNQRLEDEIAEHAADLVGRLPSIAGEEGKESEYKLEAAITELEAQLAKGIVDHLKKTYKLK